ncbi:Sulfotransfer_1 domain-containing protein, partial [Cephalotus follicularis]
LQALPSDVILASFPKTGTTWLKSLRYSIINRSSRESLLENHPHLLIPTLEIQLYGPQLYGPRAQSTDTFSTTNSSTGILATHLPHQILAETLNSSDCRIVCVTKNPKDTLVSFILKLPYSSFYIKGEVGAHKNYLNLEMIEHIDRVVRVKFHGSGFLYGI